MTSRNPLMERLGLTHPILQAPMAGGGDTPDMVIAAGESGALGSLACAYRTPDQIRAATSTVRSALGRSFGVNLFAPNPAPEKPASAEDALRFVAPYYEELGLGAPDIPNDGGFDFDDQLAAALDSGAALFSFTFGLMPAPVIEAAKSRGMLVMGTATTVEEAVNLEASGAEAIIAQGAEAGGHRGTFGGDSGSGMIGSISLVPQVVSTVDVPVVATGGIADGRGIAAALALGASAAQLGTAFLTCTESGIPDAYRQAILAAGAADTTVTSAFSGRPARGIVNRFMREAEGVGAEGAILAFPLQNALTRPIRAEAAKRGDAGLLSLWAGQGLGLARSVSTRAQIETLVKETEAAIRDLMAL